MAAYRWLLADDAVAVFGALTVRQRRVLFRHIESIATSPEQSVDFEAHIGAKDFVKTRQFGAWLITWWIDGPVKEIHVLEIGNFER